jgi:hypothetical protein
MSIVLFEIVKSYHRNIISGILIVSVCLVVILESFFVASDNTASSHIRRNLISSISSTMPAVEEVPPHHKDLFPLDENEIYGTIFLTVVLFIGK